MYMWFISLQVYYNKSGSPTDFRALTNGTSVTVAGLTAAETVLYWVEVMNSRGSNRSVNNFTVTLRDSAPGPVQSLTVTDIANTSVTLSWTEPAVRNGVIDGYSVYVNSRQVCNVYNLHRNIDNTKRLQNISNTLFSIWDIVILVSLCIFPQVVSCISLQNTQYTAMGLRPSTRYSFAVRACTDAGK